MSLALKEQIQKHQRNDIFSKKGHQNFARKKKNYEKIQKYEKMAKGLVTLKSGKIYLLSHTFCFYTTLHDELESCKIVQID